jgi:hypothetical protein
MRRKGIIMERIYLVGTDLGGVGVTGTDLVRVQGPEGVAAVKDPVREVDRAVISKVLDWADINPPMTENWLFKRCNDECNPYWVRTPPLCPFLCSMVSSSRMYLHS